MSLNNNEICILVIGYNRPEILEETLKSIKEHISFECDYLISIDGPKSTSDLEDVAKSISIAEKFNPKHLIKSDTNIGLFDNIVQSISFAAKKYSKILVLEDDVCLIHNIDKQDFLNNHGVTSLWSIYTKPFINNKFLKDQHFVCWGWVISSKTWLSFIKFLEVKNDLFLIRDYFLYTKHDVPCLIQLINNFIGRKNTWAFYMNIFLNMNSINIYSPKFSYVSNIGSQKGTHQSKEFPDQSEIKFIDFSCNDYINFRHKILTNNYSKKSRLLFLLLKLFLKKSS
ncbi:hypothetical protein N8835_03150 [Alphaproteobacteria bacterium]|nr:hypothetical protein [Alphaproteobacteria bacterium]